MQFFYKRLRLDYIPIELNLSGFTSRTDNKRLGLSDLSVSVIWLKNASPNSNLIFISIDTLYIPLEISNPIYMYLMENYHVTKDQIVFNATHTHSAPALEKRFRFNKKIDNSYIAFIINEILGIFSKVSGHDFIDGKMLAKQILMPKNMIISRRKKGFDIRSLYLKRKTIMLPNGDNEIDDSIRLLLFLDGKNKVKFIVYNFSCHPVFDDCSEPSSDFIGAINRKINKQLNIPAFFLQGFLGDIRPNFTTSNLFEVDFINKTKILMNGVIFKPFQKKEFDLFCVSVVDSIQDSCKNINSILTTNEDIKSNNKEYVLVSETNKVSKIFYVKIYLIGNVIFISIPAEVTSTYYVNLSNFFPNYIIFQLSLAENIIGYLPFYKESIEGGYEVDSATNYGWDSKISHTSLKDFYFDLCDAVFDLTKKGLI